MEDFRLRADGLMARLIPKSLTLVTNETMFNNTLLGLSYGLGHLEHIIRI